MQELVYTISIIISYCVKCQRKVLTPQISNRFYELENIIADEKGFIVVKCKVGEGDYIHCFVSATPKIFVTQIVMLSMVEYKLLERGKYFVKVGKWYPSSQLCSCCGKLQKLKLSDRVYRCSCGFIANRDYNAAQNILM